ncbi:nickel pincer cofactor biosynthesis protein LarC [Anaeromicropila herbilytica]|uniref:Pyridinium-3,5-bisthiocarboxylic acid mononucleotide nickel insertion protein n=1 Tax=Anaeromicropila herbilytica TaxID=2785025 RepID=A0A7R7EJ31_9FIRM|nr:nickel pincer cofactor biosynthesis protein LarC [Anaeromicropila herbilytica]BCN29357.1 UPF0272 protein [Anaeromicropila herbilytica]
MGKTLYLECNSGISGDMTVAALLDLGADQKVLFDTLNKLNLVGYQLHVGRTKKCGIDACDFDVILEENEDYNSPHIHESMDDSNHANQSIENSKHTHSIHEIEDSNHHHSNHSINDSDHMHEVHHMHFHEHRNIKDIYEIINRLDDENIKELSKKIFDIVAKAEAKAHGIPLEDVHFHEVGAIDSIVDIVATAICINNLGITEVIVSPLAEGSGTVKCQHGRMPVPVPAVVNIAMMNDLIIKTTNNQGEMITPTGAAIAAALRTRDSLPDQYRIKNIGIGAGKKDFESANILRAIIIEEIVDDKIVNNKTTQNATDQTFRIRQNENTSSNNSEEIIWKLESNIDDCTGEALGYTMEKLLEAGARDVYYTPIYMKKNRPAYLLSVLCKEKDCSKLEDVIFRHTTTIGIRRISYERTILDREIIAVKTPYGMVKAKLCKSGESTVCYPEYQSVREICEKENMEFQQVYTMIIHEYYLGLER